MPDDHSVSLAEPSYGVANDPHPAHVGRRQRGNELPTQGHQKIYGKRHNTKIRHPAIRERKTQAAEEREAREGGVKAEKIPDAHREAVFEGLR